jgi:hypothetical protein
MDHATGLGLGVRGLMDGTANHITPDVSCLRSMVGRGLHQMLGTLGSTGGSSGTCSGVIILQLGLDNLSGMFAAMGILVRHLSIQV